MFQQPAGTDGKWAHFVWLSVALVTYLVNRARGRVEAKLSRCFAGGQPKIGGWWGGLMDRVCSAERIQTSV